MQSSSQSLNLIYRRLAAPFFFLLMFSLATVLGLILFVTHNQNQAEISRSTLLAKAIVERQKRTLGDSVKESGYWDQAVDNLVNRLDPDWADSNVGSYVYDALGISSSYVLDPSNRLVYSSLYGERVEDDPVSRFSGGLPVLLDKARSGAENDEPEPATGILRDGDSVHFVAAIELTTYFEKDGVSVNRGTDHILIFTMRIDKMFSSDIAENYLLPEFRHVFAPDGSDGPMLILTGPDSSALGALTWKPDLPGNKALPILLAAVVGVFALMAVITYVFMGRAASIARESQDLIVAKELADQESAFKSKFMASISHELRTPLNAILGFGQLLRMEPAENSREDDSIALEQIEANGAHLLALVDQILSLSKIEQGLVELDWNAVAPLELIQECLDATSGLAAAKGVSMTWATGETPADPVITDRMKLKQILVNFLSNGIKYNSEGGTVKVRLETEGDAAITIYVDDTGQGIADEQQEQVFQPFNRLGREASNIGGGGIGLSLCRELAVLIGAEIGFVSTLGEGSSFWIRLPRDGTA